VAIQVGAAFAVLLTPKGEGDGLPLELQAAKCRMLHTEPAAGAVGLSALTCRLLSQQRHSLMIQLRTMNPYVTSAFQVPSPPTPLPPPPSHPPPPPPLPHPYLSSRLQK
jgi:hypothetical protein